jgi:hypothetical protein
VDASRARDVAHDVVSRYRSLTGQTAPFWISRPADGARLLSL